VDEAALRGAADVPAGTVTLRSRPDGVDLIAHPPAVSLPRALELAGVAPAAVSFVAVQRPNGSSAVLHAPDLARPAPFPDGPPLIWLDADSVRFFRPVRDDADVNAADNIATAGEDLAVEVRQGPLLQVTLRVSPAAPCARERTRLEARVTGASPGSPLTVRWRFGDGTEARGAAVSHRWDAAGVYTLVASAEGTDDSAGASEPLVVRVGKPRTRRGPAGGGSDDPDRAAAGGRAEPAPTDNAPEPAAEDPERAPAGAPAAAADTPKSSPAPAAPATTTRSRRTPERVPRKRRLRARRDGDDSSGVLVRGVLVAATGPAAVATGVPAAARRGGAPVARDFTLIAAAAAACALFALGAFRERRRRQP
jgi:hypothetical protein